MSKVSQKKIGMILLLLCGYAANGSAQSVQDVSGKVYKVKTEENLTGTTLLFPEFLNGEVQFSGQRSVKDLLLNFDAFSNVLLFKNAAGEIRELTGAVESFKIYDTTNENKTLILFRSGYDKILNFDRNTFYEVRYDGKLKFLKKVNKYIIEKTDYSAGAKGSEIKEKEFYFIFKDGKLVQVSKNQKSVLAVFTDKREILEKFILENKINLKNEHDIIKFLTFYDEF